MNALDQQPTIGSASERHQNRISVPSRGAVLIAQEGGELFVLFEEVVLEIGAEDVMTVLDAADDGGELATHPAVHTGAPKIAAILSPVSRHRPSSQLRSNSLWMGKCRLKTKLRQYSIWAIAWKRERLSRFRSLAENFGPRISVQ
jgi:hypothetical protein